MVTAARSPWQNGVAERFVATVRRELLDHVIILNERHLDRLLGSHIAYYNEDRTHLSICKDSPLGRPVEQRPARPATVVRLPRVGGLHRRYAWHQALLRRNPRSEPGVRWSGKRDLNIDDG